MILLIYFTSLIFENSFRIFWIANFVLLDYGTGAIMAVPGHDQRDWEFASQYELPICQVIYPATADTPVDLSRGAYTGKGLLCNSGLYDELDFDLAFEAIVAVGPVPTYTLDYAYPRGLAHRRSH